MINLIAIPLAILLKNEDGSDMSMMDLFHAGKEIMWPIRAAVSGRVAGADLQQSLFLLGRDRTLERLMQAQDYLAKYHVLQ